MAGGDAAAGPELVITKAMLDADAHEIRGHDPDFDTPSAMARGVPLNASHGTPNKIHDLEPDRVERDDEGR